MSANINPEDNERWLSDGYCAACRRLSYCRKPCKAQKQRKQAILRELMKAAKNKAQIRKDLDKVRI
ncbi:MAG: hypothetical protein IJI25_08810 [Eubacterium sp.]|nr:hypothetical protein [Eubacterium sp.]